MGKVLIFNGSPRPKGFSMQTIAEVIRGIESVGGQYKIYDLNHPDIRPCQGCMYCFDWQHEACCQNDYLAPMYMDIKECDSVVVTGPIYFCQPSAQAKIWLDRMCPQNYGEHLIRYPFKKYLTIYPVGDVDYSIYEPHMQFFDEMLDLFQWEKQDRIVVNGTYRPGYVLEQSIKDRAFQAGVALAQYEAPIYNYKEHLDPDKLVLDPEATFDYKEHLNG